MAGRAYVFVNAGGFWTQQARFDDWDWGLGVMLGVHASGSHLGGAGVEQIEVGAGAGHELGNRGVHVPMGQDAGRHVLPIGGRGREGFRVHRVHVVGHGIDQGGAAVGVGVAGRGAGHVGGQRLNGGQQSGGCFGAGHG